jgi:hypothetical protein
MLLPPAAMVVQDLEIKISKGKTYQTDRSPQFAGSGYACPSLSGKVTKANERARINRPAGRAILRKEENRSPTLSDSLSHYSKRSRTGSGSITRAGPAI